jgi:hypothetical protein
MPSKRSNRRKKRAHSSPQGTQNASTSQDDEIIPPVLPQISSAAQTTYDPLPQSTSTIPITYSDAVVPPVPAQTVPVTHHDTAVLSVPSQSTSAVPTTGTYHLHAGTTLNVPAGDQYNYHSYTVQRMFCSQSLPLPAG